MRRHDLEHPIWPGELERPQPRLRLVRPSERLPGERLEPRLLLRPRVGRLELEVEMRPARVAGRADEADLLAGRKPRPRDDRRLEDGEVAVRPDLPVRGTQRE